MSEILCRSDSGLGHLTPREFIQQSTNTPNCAIFQK